jgi:hypothetical protein
MSQQQPPGNNPRPEYVDSLTESGVADGTLPKPMEDLLDRDFPLSNIKSGDREFFRLKAENIRLYLEELYPPRESIFTGIVGAALMEDPGYGKKPMGEEERLRLETAAMDHFTLSSRGLGGWQQDKLSETISTNRVEDNRTKEEDKQGGLSGLFS